MSESTDTDNRFIVNTTMVDAGSAVSEKTIGEILSAYNQGKIVTFRTYGFPDHEFIDVEMYSVSKTDDGAFAVSAMTVDEINGLLMNAFISYTSNMEERRVVVSSHPLTAGNRFIVTLTPTAADYSGTMDKTVAEINAAYEAGREVLFRFPYSETVNVDLPVSNVIRKTGSDYLTFQWMAVAANMLVTFAFEYTGADDNTYVTTIYNLSHPSANGVSF